ncbi:MAG: extracellular solute-binding protein [Oscillospiraceae bacterium]|nr:extracellular solute-binding protein [Oscillospiraceae bacterium]
MKKLLALLLALCMVLSLAACGKKPADTDGTGASQDAGNNEDTEWTYIHVENTGNFQKEELVTGTGMNAVDTEILNNDDLINPEKFSGKKLQIYGYASSTYEDIDNMGQGSFIWMVRAAISEWAALNKVEIDFVGGYDQSAILGDINAGGKPDLLLSCDKFPLPALTGITRAFTQEEYDQLAKTCGNYYLDMMNYKGQSYGVQVPWSGGNLCYYNKTLFEQYGVKSPGEYFMEDNWNWDTYEKAITDITKDTDGDGTIDIYGSGCTYLLIPRVMVRRLNDDGKVESLIRNSEQFMRFLSIFYRASQETKAEGKYSAAFKITTPQPAISINDGEWYNFEHLYHELLNDQIVEAIPVPKYTNDDQQYYMHTLVHMAPLSSCDENEATISLMNYILRVGMRYMSDFSLGLYKCNYEGIRGASKFAHDWKQNFEEIVADRQERFDALEGWDQELYQKLQDAVLSADSVHYIVNTFPGEDGSGVHNNEANKMPPASSMPIIAAREEAWIQVYNDLYAK